MHELIIKRKNKYKKNFLSSSGNYENLIKVFTLSLEENILLSKKDILCCLNYKDNIIIGTEDGTIKIYNINLNNLYTFESAHNSSIYSLIILDGKLLSCSSDRTIKVWDIENKKLLLTFLGHENHVYGLHKITENIFISYSLDRTIKMWDLNLKKIIKVIKNLESSPMCLDNTKEFIFVGLGNGNINIYELKTFKLINQFQAHNETINSIAISDKYIFSAGRDRYIKIWDDEFNLSKEILAHKSVIWKLLIDSSRLISVSDDKQIKLWDLNNFDNVDTLQVHSDWVSDLCSDGKNIYTVSGDGTLSILNKIPYYDCSKINLEKEKIEKSPFETLEEYQNKVNSIEKEFENRIINYEYINIGNIELIFDSYNLQDNSIQVKAYITCDKFLKYFQIKKELLTIIKIDLELAKEIYKLKTQLHLYVRFFKITDYKFYLIFKSNLIELDFKNQVLEEEKLLGIKTARLQIKPLKPDEKSLKLNIALKDGNLLNLGDTFKTPFETYEEFILRMKEKFIKKEAYIIGKADFSAINYSIENNSFSFIGNITVEKILNIIDFQKTFHGQIFIEKNKAKSLFENNKIQNLYIQFIENSKNIYFYLLIHFSNEIFYVF
ncbi:MAG: hypothetical protein KatS3mg068_1325 [Candidatus Sericytochromatia bacterium]|nr:MAG: hypothetical protein KatS3mg068_1325 [Candidatus Sericytochromatia bacterium]